MKSINSIKEAVESLDTATRVSIEYDREYGEYIQLQASDAPAIEELDRICEEYDAVMQPEGQNPWGEYEYVFR